MQGGDLLNPNDLMTGPSCSRWLCMHSRGHKGILFFHLFNPFSLWFQLHWQTWPTVALCTPSAHWPQAAPKASRTQGPSQQHHWKHNKPFHLFVFGGGCFCLFAFACLLNEYFWNTVRSHFQELGKIKWNKIKYFLPLATEMTDNERWVRFASCTIFPLPLAFQATFYG